MTEEAGEEMSREESPSLPGVVQDLLEDALGFDDDTDKEPSSYSGVIIVLRIIHPSLPDLLDILTDQ